MRTKSQAIVRFAVLLTLACSTALPQHPPSATPSEPRWSPLIEFDGQLFPAAILSLASRRVENMPPTYFGDPNGILGIAFESPTPRVRVKVTVRVDRLAEESSFETLIPHANRAVEIFPTIRFDSRALAKIQESFPTTVAFSVWADGVPLGGQTRTIQVRAVNDAPFAYQTRDGKTQDFSSLFAAFVNENHPWIDGVLKEALDANAIRQFIGYQGSSDDVVRQVFAIWNVLQRRSVKYSSITQPSGDSRTVASQHVRFLDESIRYSQANCVDGTVLFASILYKIGLHPVLALKPGHMFLGVHLAQPLRGQRPNWMFLETTLIGNPGLNSIQRGWKFLTPQGYRDSESYRQFLNAVNAGNHAFQTMVNGLNSRVPGYAVIDVAAARKSGIAAIPRF